MLEIMPYIILILIILALELTQISFSKSKIGKWVLPVLSFLFSIYMMIFFITFELSDFYGDVEVSLKMIDIGTWMMFPVLNIPTIIFILTSVIVNKLSKNKEPNNI